MSWPWSELGLPGPADLRSIRRAYAQRLKTTHPEDDPEGFQRLHAAYQEASRYARRQAQQKPPAPQADREQPSPGPSRYAAREDDLQETAEKKTEDTKEPEWDYEELLKDQQSPKKPPSESEQPKEPEWDYEELLKDQQGPQKPSEEPEQPKEPEWDYEELLKDQQGPKKPSEEPEQPREPEWDYEELLKDQQGPKKPPERTEQAKEPGWDYDELLEDDSEETETEEESEEEAQGSDWDYERLFAEGEAEAQQARRRRMEELRRKNRARYTAQEQEQRKRAADEEEAWTAVMAAAHALELLYSTGAPLHQWTRFLNDSVFLNVRANIDFIFALEDFIEQHPDLSPDIRRAIFTAYEAQNGSKYAVYSRLYRLLDVDRKEKRRIRKAKSAWRAQWRSYPPWRKGIIVVCMTILALFFLLAVSISVRDTYNSFMEKKTAEQWEVQSLAWLEEDFGEPFTQPLGGGSHKNIYAPAAEPNLYFWMLKDGEREGRWPGYRTDYPHIRIMHAMKDFASEWNLGLKLDGAGGFSGDLGDAPGAYLFDLPLQGAGEAITALGELIKELESQDWYRVLEDKYDGEVVYQVFLCHNGLGFYDAISNKDGGFDADYARARYETQVGPAYCRYLLEETGLPAKHMGEDTYVLLDQGTVDIEDKQFFWVSGLDKESYESRVEYLLVSGGGMLFCLPGNGLKRSTTIADLYRGSSTTIEMKGAGFVLIMDQIETS